MLISTNTTIFGALLVHPVLACLCLYWNELQLRRWNWSLLPFGLGVLASVLSFMFYGPSKAWLACHLVMVVPLVILALRQKGLLIAASFRGVASLHVYPVLLALASIQGYAFFGPPPKAVEKPISATQADSSATPTASTVYRRGQLTVECRQLPEQLGARLTQHLVSQKFWDDTLSGWAGMDVTPMGLRIVIVLRSGQILDAKAEQKLDKAIKAFLSELEERPPLVLEIYSHDKRPVKAFKL